jgi:hypothetical protein
MQPITRDYLLNLKAQTDEEARIKFIQDYSHAVYSWVKHTAKTTTQTCYKHPLFTDRETTTNISDILSKLKILFPDSAIGLNKNLENKEIETKFNGRKIPTAFIVIDWS